MAEERFIIDTNVDQDVWDLWRRHIDAFWTVDDIQLTSQDALDWENLKPEERKFVEHILSFFATSDNIVNENLLLKLYEKIEAPAARAFYSFQGAMETIHSVMYDKLLKGYVKDLARLKELQRGLPEGVREMVEWCQTWLREDVSVAERLLIFCCIEGVFFSGPFCVIYWLAQRGVLPALCNSNKLIAPDEGMHVDHGMLQSIKWPDRVPEPRARALFMDAVRVAERFINGSVDLDCSMIGMSQTLMADYIHHVANNIFVRLGYPALFERTVQPFAFMSRLCFDSKENFLEMRPFNYQLPVIDEFNTEADI